MKELKCPKPNPAQQQSNPIIRPNWPPAQSSLMASPLSMGTTSKALGTRILPDVASQRVCIFNLVIAGMGGMSSESHGHCRRCCTQLANPSTVHLNGTHKWKSPPPVAITWSCTQCLCHSTTP